MKANKYKISVAMAVCNGENFIAEQLFSILEQTMPVDEIIICDDSKNENTYNVLKYIVEKNPNIIKYYHNTRVLGVSKNFAKAISLTTKDFVMLADQDDLWLPNKVSSLYQTLLQRYDKKHHPYCGAFCDSCLVDKNLSSFKPSINHLQLRGFSEADILNSQNDRQKQFDLFLKRVPIAGHNMMFTKESKEVILPFPKLKECHDSWIGYNIAALDGWIFCAAQLTLFRQHDNNVSNANSHNQFQEAIDSLRNNTFKWNMKLFIALSRRLHSRISKTFIAELKDRCEHSQRRSTMLQMSFIKRLFIVFSELKNRRYLKYSRGLKSAFQDLILNIFIKH